VALMMNQFSRNKGFTIPELVVVLALVSIITLTVFSTYRTVWTSYEKGQASVDMAENARVALRDITERLNDSPFSLNASAQNMSLYSSDFPVFTDLSTAARTFYGITDPDPFTLEFRSGPMTYKYTLDTVTHYLMLSSLTTANNLGTEEPLAFGVRNIRYLFWDPNGNSGTGHWKVQWNNGSIPKSVYIEIKLQDNKGVQNPRVFTTLVTLN